MVGPFFVPATPAGGMEILKRNKVNLQGKHAVVVGRSNIVGKPMALLLLRENASVSLCHSQTADLPGMCRTADILCAAVGKASMIKGDWIKPGAVVIDFGVNFVGDKMVGDVDFEAAVKVAGMITPVPGGTGPMTNIMLMKNVIEAAKVAAGLK
jgi:methylenetetrahydrofolate dehydrogenase (NADP+)/methenyltetrahydrofolate cyclohydrolase